MTDERDVFDFEEEPAKAPARPQPTAPRESTEIAWGVILVLVGLALLIVFMVQNSDAVPVKFLWAEGTFSLAIVILIAVGVTVLISELVGVAYRRGRRKRRQEREALRQLRRDS